MSSPIYSTTSSENVKNKNNIFYVYGYLRSKDSKTASKGTFYYIGKGSNGRAYMYHKKIPVPKNKNNIIFFARDISESVAFEIEIELIKHYGRRDKCTGILLNRTDGGDNPPNHIGLKRSKKTIDLMSKSQTGENSPHFSGYYHVPHFGKFASSTALKNKGLDPTPMRKYCKTKNTTIISKMVYIKSKFLQSHFGPEIIGQTFRAIGFWFDPI